MIREMAGDWFGRFVLAFSAAMLVVLALAIRDAIVEQRACTARGGQMVVVGTHMMPVTQWVGKVAVITMQRVNDTRCSVP